jgi:hypothetical protein
MYYVVQKSPLYFPLFYDDRLISWFPLHFFLFYDYRLGTCDITEKKGKYISVKSYPYQKIEFALNKYRTLKSRLLQANPEATVVFLECPYYSITRFNKFKITNSNSKTGTNKYYQRNAIAASRADKQVCCMVDYFNDHLRLINRNCGTPRISQDIIASSKGARAERTSYKKNWNV